MVNKSVSIIVPLYGAFDPQRVLISVQSLRLQKNIKLEIIVSEINHKPSFTGELDFPEVKYIFSPAKDLVDEVYFRPGYARNVSVKNSAGSFIYNSDGDIVIPYPNYFEKLFDIMDRSERMVLRWPPMRRIPIECFDEFKEEFNSNGIEGAIKILDTTQPFVATTPKNHVAMRIFRKTENGEEKVFLYTQQDHRTYRADPSNKGQEPKFSTLGVHAGAIFMTRSQFEQVGGYCEDYVGWGCHDEDLQWKLAQLFDLQRIPSEPSFEVLHIDHPRGYFSRDIWDSNKELRKKRETEGIDTVLDKDIRRYRHG